MNCVRAKSCSLLSFRKSNPPKARDAFEKVWLVWLKVILFFEVNDAEVEPIVPGITSSEIFNSEDIDKDDDVVGEQTSLQLQSLCSDQESDCSKSNVFKTQLLTIITMIFSKYYFV